MRKLWVMVILAAMGGKGIIGIIGMVLPKRTYTNNKPGYNAWATLEDKSTCSPTIAHGNA
jgi:hypothetical protein